MPLFRFRCPDCGADKQRIASAEPAEMVCSCGGAMIRAVGVPGVFVVERLDNGIMVRPLERIAEQPRLHKERVKLAEKKDDDT